jgi:negative regulator of sigma E activity
LYQKSLVSDAEYSYSGQQFITTYRDDDRSVSTATQVLHQAGNDFRITYAAPKTLAGRVILQRGGDQWTLLPKRHVIVHDRLPSAAASKTMAAKFDLLERNYRLIVAPKPSRIADRKVFEVSVSPRDGRGVSRRLWIDPATGLVLRAENFHSDGTLAVVSYFSEIRMHPKFDQKTFSLAALTTPQTRTIEQRDPSEQKIAREDLPHALDGAAIAPDQLEGYVLQSASLLPGKKRTLHLRYSDGLGSLSLFETLRAGKKPTRIARSLPLVLSSGKAARVTERYSYNVLNWDSGAISYTLIGDASLRLLTRIADAVPPATHDARR